MEIVMKKLLVTEDDFYLRRDLKEILEKSRYQVVTASSVKEAIWYVYNDDSIDLYLLDVWLPDGEGFDVCKKIREKNQKPIIFLTVCDAEEDVVKGLSLGGDDYVMKPFRTRELLSRIQANLRRMETRTENKFLKCGEVLLDLQQEVVKRDGEEIKLRPVEYRILHKLMENAERIVKREQLLSCLWDGEEAAVEDNTLSVHMSRLRGKIGGEYIDTVRGFGYRFTQKKDSGTKRDL